MANSAVLTVKTDEGDENINVHIEFEPEFDSQDAVANPWCHYAAIIAAQAIGAWSHEEAIHQDQANEMLDWVVKFCHKHGLDAEALLDERLARQREES